MLLHTGCMPWLLHMDCMGYMPWRLCKDCTRRKLPCKGYKGCMPWLLNMDCKDYTPWPQSRGCTDCRLSPLHRGCTLQPSSAAAQNSP